MRSGVTIEQVAARIRERNMETIVVSDGNQAREAVLGLIPTGAEVHAGKSKTPMDIGVTPVVAAEGAYTYLLWGRP